MKKALLFIFVAAAGCATTAQPVTKIVNGKVVVSRAVRVVAATAYALLPAVTGAVAAGRLGTALAAWLLPLALWTGGRALGVGGSTSGGRAWLAGLLLAVVVAFVPLAWMLHVAPALAVRRILP